MVGFDLPNCSRSSLQYCTLITYMKYSLSLQNLPTCFTVLQNSSTVKQNVLYLPWAMPRGFMSGNCQRTLSTRWSSGCCFFSLMSFAQPYEISKETTSTICGVISTQVKIHWETASKCTFTASSEVKN
uniref:Uncharacterized protein n=1 Tax=Micrurus spixii TaxID=129469 RepID=A0A2D4MZD6_9SAUR